MYILTADLYGDDAVTTDFWVEVDELSSQPKARISPSGKNTLGIGQDEFRGMKIAQIESVLKKQGYILCKVGFDKIYFSK